MRKGIVVVGACFIAGVVWSVRLVVGDGPWPTDSAALLAASILALTSAAVVGMLVASARWAQRLALLTGAAQAFLAIFLPSDPLWWVGLGFSAVSVAGLAGGMTDPIVRRVDASGPSPTVVVLLLILLVIPGGIAAVSISGIDTAGWAAVAISLLGLVWYARAAPYAIWVVRLVVPIGLAVAGAVAGSATMLVALVAALAVTIGAWRPQARIAVEPLVTPGRPRPILPEMVPPEVRDAAGIDERGHPRTSS